MTESGVTCIFPDDRVVVIAKRRPGRLYPSTEFDPEVAIDSAIGEFYVLTSGGTERVAGSGSERDQRPGRRTGTATDCGSRSGGKPDCC